MRSVSSGLKGIQTIFSAQANFAEAHFTTGRFAEAESRIAALLANPKLDLSTGLGLRTVHVATMLALNKPESAPSALTALRDFVGNLPSGFETIWGFEGSRHFIGDEPMFAHSRAWLLDLFAAVEEKDGQKKLAALSSDSRTSDSSRISSRQVKQGKGKRPTGIAQTQITPHACLGDVDDAASLMCWGH